MVKIKCSPPWQPFCNWVQMNQGEWASGLIVVGGVIPNCVHPLSRFDSHFQVKMVTCSVCSQQSYEKIGDGEQSRGAYHDLLKSFSSDHHLFILLCNWCKWSAALWVMFNAAWIFCSPGSLINDKPHNPKYVCNASINKW